MKYGDARHIIERRISDWFDTWLTTLREHGHDWDDPGTETDQCDCLRAVRTVGDAAVFDLANRLTYDWYLNGPVTLDPLAPPPGMT